MKRGAPEERTRIAAQVWRFRKRSLVATRGMPSPGDTLLSGFGFPVSASRGKSPNQTISQARPIVPGRRKAICQEKWIVSHTTTGGATAEPTKSAELKIPPASARSSVGNHWEIDLSPPL